MTKGVLKMTVKDLLTVAVSSHIYIITENEDKYYSTDNGLTFKRSVFNNDTSITEEILNSQVRYFKPVTDYAIYIYI